MPKSKQRIFSLIFSAVSFVFAEVFLRVNAALQGSTRAARSPTRPRTLSSGPSRPVRACRLSLRRVLGWGPARLLSRRLWISIMTRIRALDCLLVAIALFLLFIAGISCFQGAASLSFAGIPLFALGLCLVSAMLSASLYLASRDSKLMIVIIFVSALLGTYGAEIYVAGEIYQLKVAQSGVARAVAAQMGGQDPAPQQPWRSGLMGRQEAASLDFDHQDCEWQPGRHQTEDRSHRRARCSRRSAGGAAGWISVLPVLEGSGAAARGPVP